ncbi:hypothetical protein MVUOKPPV_CDS0002 [Klebsiella phage phi1_175008]|uniref:Uncharacterized protein n=1 Tax=Klebsiella phage phi1_175008 TaxID=3127744 RepID=A0ACD5FRJ8_9CAUD
MTIILQHPEIKSYPYLHRIIIGNIYQLNIIITDYFTYNLPQKLQNFSYIPGIFKPPPIWQRNVNNINMLASIWRYCERCLTRFSGTPIFKFPRVPNINANHSHYQYHSITYDTFGQRFTVSHDNHDKLTINPYKSIVWH